MDARRWQISLGMLQVGGRSALSFSLETDARVLVPRPVAARNREVFCERMPVPMARGAARGAVDMAAGAC